ncbi:sensor domain-containing diguanylate cyclase [Candidatus Nitrospira bockiana]
MNAARVRKIPLQTKTILALATGLVVCSALVTITQYRITSRTLASEWEAKAVESSRLVAFAFQPLLQAEDRAALTHAVTQMLSVPGIKSLTVVDAHGVIIADSKGQGVGTHLALHLDALRQALEHDKEDISWVETKETGRIRFLLAPIKPRSEDAGAVVGVQGAVLMGLDLSVLDRLIRTNLSYLLVLNGITIVALLLMFWIAIRIGVIQPLHVLAETMRAVPAAHAGDTGAPSDEIATLTESFSRLTEALQESELLNRATLNSIPAHAALLDKEGFLLAVNTAWEHYAREGGEAFPTTGGGLVNYCEACRDSARGYGERAAEAIAGIRSVLAGTAPSFSLEYTTAPGREARRFLLTAVPLQRAQGGAVISHTDVTSSKRSEDILARSLAETERARARLDSLYRTIPFGLMYVTPDLTIERISQSMAQVQGRPIDEQVGRSLSAVLSPERWMRLKPVVEQVFKTGKPHQNFEEAVPDPGDPDAIRFLLSHLLPDLADDGTVRGIHIAMQDVTTERLAQKEREQDLKELRAKNRELDQMAIRDPLTGLYNRRFFDEALTREWQQFQRSGEAFTVIIMDVDAFKAINDDYGHEAGDRALQQVATTLKANLRESDLIARVGGDEFAALLPRTDMEQSLQVAEKLTDVLRGLRLGTADGDIPMSLSLGAATVPGFPPVTSAAELLRVADKRMYEAKRLASARRSDAG